MRFLPFALPFASSLVACSDSVPSPAAPAPAPAPAPVAAVPAVAPAGAFTGPAIDRIRQRGSLLVGIDTGEPEGAGTPPMYFPDAAGKPDGFDYHVAKWVATTLGVPDVKVVHGKYSELPALLVDKQQFDVLISGYTPADKAGIAWTDGYLDFGLCLVVPARSTVKTTADLWGKSIGIFDDDAAATAVEKMVKGYTDLVRMEDGYWDALEAGKFAGFIYDYPYANSEIQQWYLDNPKKKGAFRIAQYNLTDDHYTVGVRASEPDLLAAANEAIKRFKASDDYGSSVRTYLSGGSKVAAPTDLGRVYVVVAGDTLSKIAARELQDAGKWHAIWALNKDRFPNPDLIEVGDEVVLPA